MIIIKNWERHYGELLILLHALGWTLEKLDTKMTIKA